MVTRSVDVVDTEDPDVTKLVVVANVGEAPELVIIVVTTLFAPLVDIVEKMDVDVDVTNVVGTVVVVADSRVYILLVLVGTDTIEASEEEVKPTDVVDGPLGAEVDATTTADVVALVMPIDVALMAD